MADEPGGGRPEARDADPLNRSLRLERVLMAAAMAAVCVIAMANVVVRYFTNISFAFTEEVSVFLMVFMTLLGASSAFVGGRHINVGLLLERLPAPGRRAMRLLALGASGLMFATLAWYGGRMAWDDYRYEVTTPALGIAQWLYTVWLPLLSLLVLLRLAQLARREFAGR